MRGEPIAELLVDCVDKHKENPYPYPSSYVHFFQKSSVGIHLAERTLLVGACIWGTESADVAPLEQLAADIPKISPLLPSHWRVQCLAFLGVAGHLPPTIGR